MYAEAYLKPRRTCLVEPLCENYKKALFYMFDWVLNTHLAKVLNRKGLQNVNIYLIWPKSTTKFCRCPLVPQINKKHVGLTLS